VLASLPLGAQAGDGVPAPPLYTNIGAFRRQVTTRNPQAQRYVNQGLTFLYSFNYGEAMRSFRQAAVLDPDCAMAWWGIATANGPHINDPSVSPEHAQAALNALHKAQPAMASATPVEQALLRAAAKRFADPPPADRKPLDQAYADAMRQVWKDFPNDADVGALFAESLMDLRPWDLWTSDKKPQPGTEEITATLDVVLKLDPVHPLGNHLMIHAWEASATPEKADAAADRLRDLTPGIAHMVHMPSHIDVERGRWREAILANERAVADDKAYLQGRPVRGIYAGYMAHNYHMLAFAAMMSGQSKRAIHAIDEMIARLGPDFVRENPPVADGSGFLAMPLEVRMRFGLWDEILAAPEPPETCPITRALRHYARGVAYAAQKRFNEAHEEQTQFREAQQKVAPNATCGLSPAKDIFALADHVLAGELLFQMGRREEGLAELRKGVESEDALHYDEPPDWIQPVRHALGAALMTAGRYAEAEQVYREDLAKRPENGWGLFGLMRSLEQQGKKDEATPIRARFENVWKDADIRLSTSCLCLPWT
jgi:tetratricopeptide (TPR) repeat protein